MTTVAQFRERKSWPCRCDRYCDLNQTRRCRARKRARRTERASDTVESMHSNCQEELDTKDERNLTEFNVFFYTMAVFLKNSLRERSFISIISIAFYFGNTPFSIWTNPGTFNNARIYLTIDNSVIVVYLLFWGVNPIHWSRGTLVRRPFPTGNHQDPTNLQIPWWGKVKYFLPFLR